MKITGYAQLSWEIPKTSREWQAHIEWAAAAAGLRDVRVRESASRAAWIISARGRPPATRQSVSLPASVVNCPPAELAVKLEQAWWAEGMSS